KVRQREACVHKLRKVPVHVRVHAVGAAHAAAGARAGGERLGDKVGVQAAEAVRGAGNRGLGRGEGGAECVGGQRGASAVAAGVALAGACVGRRRAFAVAADEARCAADEEHCVADELCCAADEFGGPCRAHANSRHGAVAASDTAIPAAFSTDARTILGRLAHADAVQSITRYAAVSAAATADNGAQHPCWQPRRRPAAYGAHIVAAHAKQGPAVHQPASKLGAALAAA
ncbi:hypothetical protein IWW50_006761, partial [Coemansia erecta]